MNRKKIGIVYHSGSGGTRTICEVLQEKLTRDFDVELHTAHRFDGASLATFDCIVLGFPTYHCRPSASMIEFVDRLPPATTATRAVIVTTYGLYPGNSIRILAERLSNKNITAVHAVGIRAPASDGVLMMPGWVSFMFRYEKSAADKIEKTVDTVTQVVKTKPKRGGARIPAYKWYVPLNAIPRFFGERTYEKLKRRIAIDGERCTNCGVCVQSCDRACWTRTTTDPVPMFHHERCEFCLRCVHTCPTRAIGFNDAMRGAPRLNGAFYKDLKKELSDSIHKLVDET